MRNRPRHATPAHAPAWVRSRHWPAATGIAGVTALAIAVVTLHGATQTVPQHVAVAQGAQGARSQVALAVPAADHEHATAAAPPMTSIAARVTGTPAARAAAAEQLLAPDTGDSVAPSDRATVSGLASGGIPSTALDAYRRAAAHELAVDPACHLPWPLLAGIGRVESNHGRYGGAVLLSDGTSTRRILGIPLDGSRSATITDTDHGRLDGDTVYDRALGPMQFIPSTWASYGADGNGDGRKDPFNIYDAAAAAAHYLCVAGGNLSTLAGQTRAVLAYNHSSDYLALVLKLEHAYAIGVPGLIVPVLPVQTAPVHITPRPGHKPAPPVDPGPPLSAPSGPTRPHPVASTSSTRSPSPRPSSTRPGSSSPPSTTPNTSPSSGSSSCAPSSSAAPTTSFSGTSATSSASSSASAAPSDTATTPSDTAASTDSTTTASGSASSATSTTSPSASSTPCTPDQSPTS